MPAISFPASPSVNDTFTSSGKTWKWNGTFWELVISGASVADGSVSTAKIADGAITAAKIADGTIVAAEIANNAITTDKIATGAVTAAKLGNDISLTPADGSITQAKLAASLSGVTVTTTANRSTAVPSPFTGQTIYLSDVKRVQIWDGSTWMFVTNGAPGAPTSLSATPLSTTSVSVAFTTGTINGAAVTNYKYAYSSNSGSTYSEYAAFDPVDITSPVVISGLTGSTAYLIKLRAVSDFGDSVDSSPVSVTTLTAPSAPTSLSATGFYLMGRIAFTPGADGGSAITNYEYALSANGGATYGSWTALSPADTTSPIDVGGLANNTTYSIKIRAVSTAGSGAESSAVSVTTNQNVPVQYLVIAGGGSGSRVPNVSAGGGGAGGVVTHTTNLAPTANYSVSIGAGGAAYSGSSTFDGGGNNGSVTSAFGAAPNGGGRGNYYGSGSGYVAASAGGSGGGGGWSTNTGGGVSQGTVPAGATFYGNAGGTGSNYVAAGGGGAGAVGYNAEGTGGFDGRGGIGITSSITGSSVYYAGGGGAGNSTNPTIGGLGGGGTGYGGGANNATAGTINLGGGGGGSGNRGYDTYPNYPSGAGGSGVVVARYPATYTITLGVGLVGSTTTVGTDKVTTITSGSGNVSWA